MSKDVKYLLLGAILVPIIVFANISRGQANIDLATVIQALGEGQMDTAYQVILNFRLPRAVMGLLAGASLAMVGALLQTTMRNALVSAGTLGINAGAYLTAVAATVFLPAWVSGFPVLLTFAGGLLAVALVYALAGKAASSPLTMVLSGLIVTMLLGSFTNVVQIMFEHETRQLLIWGNGTLTQNGWRIVIQTWPYVVGCILLGIVAHRRLDVISLGEETASSLGLKTGVLKGAIIVLSVLLSAFIVSVTGPIGFVGLVAPHLVKLAGFRRHLTLLPASAVCGGLLLVAADTLTYRPDTIANQVPVGAVMALIGAPWLLFLALRLARKNGLGFDFRQQQVKRRLIQTSRSYWLLIAISLILLFAVTVAGSVISGGAALSVKQVVLVFAGQGDVMAEQIVRQFRLPRMLGALLAGAMLAASGLLVQGAVRNPLADPSIIGISAGAGAGVMMLIMYKPAASAWEYSAAALIGALLAAGLTFSLTWSSKFRPGIFIMVGIAVSAAFSAMIQILILQTPYSISAQIWMNGSTYGMRWPAVFIMSAAAALLLPLAWLLGRKMDLLGFDDSMAVGLGMRPASVRFAALLVGVCLSAIAVSQVGTVGFIGLLAPHAGQMMVGSFSRKKLPIVVLLGAMMLGLADLIGRVILIPNEIPSGTIVALVGAPYLFYLIWSSRQRGGT